MAKGRWVLLAGLVALVALALGGAASARQEETPVSARQDGQSLQVVEPGAGDMGPLTPMQKQAVSQGYLVPDQEAYERGKAEASEEAERLSGSESAVAAEAPRPPDIFRSWEGLRDQRVTPSDSTGAIGPTRYIELVNLKYAIYDRSDDTPVSRGFLNELTGSPAEAFVFDPQVIWDPSTRRFYYVTDDVRSETDTRLAFGFSKTANPSSAADFCKYTIRFGSRFPDYPKLGDTRGLLLVGVNSFGPQSFLGSDLVSITKPPAGSSCPSRESFTVDTRTNLQGADGERAITPVPANQIDQRDAGYVVTTSNAVYREEGSADLLSIFKVTRNQDGTMNLGKPRELSVPTYRFPANAPQPNTKNVLDTLDTRNTQAVMAVDPSFGESALWTQQTVFGGSGAEVRWYEIDPTPPRPSLLQTGRLSSPKGNFFFNAAISPDRQVNSGKSKFGDNMAIGYSTSSKSHRADIRVVSKAGNDPVSQQAVVKSSPAIMNDFACQESRGLCRWGDYSAATPDPNVPAGMKTGRVWLSNQWVKEPGSVNPRTSGWSTWNWAVKP